jgi:hypothetical protein
LKEGQREKRMQMEKEIKEVIQKNHIGVSKQMEEVAQKGTQLKREVHLMRGEMDRRLSEMGQDHGDLRAQLKMDLSALQTKVTLETQAIQNSFDQFEVKHNLKWDQLMGDYHHKINHFQRKEHPVG